jgi:hypothetical protein
MSKIIDSQAFSKGLALCQKGKHKLRENKFGVTWCVRCGLLSTTIGTAQPLQVDEQLIIKRTNDERF